jgi:fructose-1,6-bisphosphatase
MEIEPSAIHERTPIYIGSKQNVEEAMQFISKDKELTLEAG